MRGIVFVLAVVFVFSAFNLYAAEGKADKVNYYDTLKSMLSPMGRKAEPQSKGRNVNLIEPSKGAGGLLFGQSIDDLIRVWGKPSNINASMSAYGVKLTTNYLSYGASRFRFTNNKLVEIGIHRMNLPNARFANGIGFSATAKDIKKAFGKPDERRDNIFKYYDINGSTVRFVCTYNKKGALKLSSVTIGRAQ
jgi:hypothetical protein